MSGFVFGQRQDRKRIPGRQGAVTRAERRNTYPNDPDPNVKLENNDVLSDTPH